MAANKVTAVHTSLSPDAEGTQEPLHRGGSYFACRNSCWNPNRPCRLCLRTYKPDKRELGLTGGGMNKASQDPALALTVASLRHTQITEGKPFPLGATWDGLGVNFALFSAHATKVELCIFDDDGQTEIERIELPEYTDEVWHGYCRSLAPAPSTGIASMGPTNRIMDIGLIPTSWSSIHMQSNWSGSSNGGQSYLVIRSAIPTRTSLSIRVIVASWFKSAA